MRQFLAAVSVVLVISACGNDATVESIAAEASSTSDIEVIEPPQLDFSSPDRSVRTYWQVQDYARQAQEAVRVVAMTAPEYALIQELELAVVAGDARRAREMPYREINEMAREIVEVQQQTDTRAVVIARLRNISPIPEGSLVTARSAELRRDGEVVRYIVEQFADGWKVVQAESKLLPNAPDWMKHFSPDDLYVPTHIAP